MRDDFHGAVDDAVFEQGGVIEEIHQMIGGKAVQGFATLGLDGRMRQIGHEGRGEPVAGLQLLLDIAR